MPINYIDVIISLIPIISGYFIISLCKMDKQSGVDVKFRPDPVSFSIIWPILYILIGVSWAVSNRCNKLYNILYTLLTLTLITWVIIYNNCVIYSKDNKFIGCFIILISLILSIMTITNGPHLSRFLMAPLVGWLIYALLMNTTEVQMSV